MLESKIECREPSEQMQLYLRFLAGVAAAHPLKTTLLASQSSVFEGTWGLSEQISEHGYRHFQLVRSGVSGGGNCTTM